MSGSGSPRVRHCRSRRRRSSPLNRSATSLMPAGLDASLDPRRIARPDDLPAHRRAGDARLRRASTGWRRPSPAGHARGQSSTRSSEGLPNRRSRTGAIRVTLVAGQKDHGFGEHDYPRWQQVWGRLLSLAEDLEVSPPGSGHRRANGRISDVLVFFKRGNWAPRAFRPTASDTSKAVAARCSSTGPARPAKMHRR